MSGRPSRKNSSHNNNNNNNNNSNNNNSNNDEESMLSVMASNNLEFVGERLIVEVTKVERLVDYWRAFDKFEPLLDKKLNYGRLYNTRRMAQIVVATSLAMELDRGSAERDWQVDTVEPTLPDLPISEWGVRHWESLRLLMESLRDSLLRKDVAVHAGRHDPAAVDASVDGRRARSNIFTEDYNKVMAYIKLQKDLCPLRKAISKIPDEEANASSTPSDGVEEEFFVKEFWDVFVQEEDHFLQRTLGMLFLEKPKQLDRMTLANQPQLALRPINLLRNFLNDSPPFSLTLFLPKLHKLIRSCLHDVFPRRPLLDHCYLDPTEEQDKGHIGGEEDELEQDGNPETRERRAPKSRRRSARDEIVDNETSEESEDDGKARRGKTFNHVKNLVQKRNALVDASNDPLQESLKIARRAVAGLNDKRTRSPSPGNRQAKKTRRDGSGLLAKKASASRLNFDSDEDSEDDGPNLSELPRQKSPRLKSPRKKSQMKKYDGRRNWTEEEKGAIKDGVLSMGAGHWAQIKEEYPILLCDRTSVQIKDCYRTMLKKGEVELPSEAEQ